MIRRTGQPTAPPPRAVPPTGRRNGDAFSTLLSPNIPNGSVPVPADAETFETQAFDGTYLDARSSQTRADGHFSPPPTLNIVPRDWHDQPAGADPVAVVAAGTAGTTCAQSTMATLQSVPAPTVVEPQRLPLQMAPMPQPAAAEHVPSAGSTPPPAAQSATPVPEATMPCDAPLSEPHIEDATQAAMEPRPSASRPVVSATANAVVPAMVEDTARGVVEVQIKTHDGNVEVVAFPWHLSANTQLSWTSIEADVGGADAPAPGRAIAPKDVHPLSDETDLLPVSLSWLPPGRDVFAVAAAQVASVSEDASFPASSLGSASTRPLPGALWASRLVRWLEQHGKDAEVWIRDFSLDDTAARTLAGDIERVCRQQGIQLDRIIVNAREQWSSARKQPGDA